MATYNVTAENVRSRLTTWGEAEMPTATLESLTFLGAGDAWIESVLEKYGVEFGDLSGYRKVMVQNAEVAFVCSLVISFASDPDNAEFGPIKIEGLDAEKKDSESRRFLKEAKEFMRRAGYPVHDASKISSSIGGCDYEL